MTQRLFLDTCVLFPPILRGLLLGMADAGLFEPLWSDSVLAEWAHVTSGAPDVIDAQRAMRARWPEALTLPGDSAVLDLPDAGDRHVLAGAIAGRAEAIITLNIRDFPTRALAPHGLRAVRPDDLAMDLWLGARAPVEAVVARRFAGLDGRALRNALKRATLPRLGRALERD